MISALKGEDLCPNMTTALLFSSDKNPSELQGLPPAMRTSLAPTKDTNVCAIVLRTHRTYSRRRRRP